MEDHGSLEFETVTFVQKIRDAMSDSCIGSVFGFSGETDLLLFPPSTCVRPGFVALELEPPGNHRLHRGVFLFFVTPWDAVGPSAQWGFARPEIRASPSSAEPSVIKSRRVRTDRCGFFGEVDTFIFVIFYYEDLERSMKIHQVISSVKLQFLVLVWQGCFNLET